MKSDFIVISRLYGSFCATSPHRGRKENEVENEIILRIIISQSPRSLPFFSAPCDFGKENFLINNYDNKRAQLILRPNLCFITFAISLSLGNLYSNFYESGRGPSIQPWKRCKAISSSGRFRKLRNSQQCFSLLLLPSLR